MPFKLPNEPIRNRKEFLTYLLATACGVGVALSVEHAAEWWKQRTLLGEARHNLRLEVTQTRDKVRDWVKRIPEYRKNYDDLSAYTEEMLKNGISQRTSLAIKWDLSPLSSAAWRAAESTGASAHMDYAEAKLYNDLYSVQRDFERIQTMILDETAPVMAFFARGQDPTRNQKPADMEQLGKIVRTIAMRTHMAEGMAKALISTCDQALKEKK